MFPVILILFLTGFAFGGRALFKFLTQKENPPSDRNLLTLSTLGMLCILAGSVAMLI